MGDALDGHAGKIGRGAEGKAGKQGQLVRGVAAADIEGGVGLGIAFGLRFLQHIGEGAARCLHFGKDIVAGAIEDALHRIHAMRDQVFAQHFDNGDAAGGRGFELERHALVFGEFRQRQTMLGQQRLVGAYHMLAARKRGLHQLARNAFIAADQFHHHIGVALCQRQRIVLPAGDLEATRARLVARRHRGDAKLAPGTMRQLIAAPGQGFDHAAPDRAEPGDGDTKRSRHFAEASFFLGCSPLSKSEGGLLVPSCRNFFTLRAAWRMRCSFSTSATRT